MTNLSPSALNYFALAGKIDPVSEIKNSGLLTSGKVVWVKDPSDDDYIALKESAGEDNFSDTIQGGIDKCTSDLNDYVLVCPKKSGAAWTSGTTINMNKNKVHLISVGYSPVLAGTAGYSNTIQGWGTSDTTVVPATGFVKFTGHGCEMAGFRFVATAGTALLGSVGTDGTTGLITIESNGNWFHDLAVERRGAAWDVGTPAALVCAGSTHSQQRFDRVHFNAGTQTASNMYCVKLPQSGLDWEFNDCTFWKLGIATTDQPVVAAGGTADGIHASFENCKFVNKLGTAPDSCVGGSMPVGALILMKNCGAYGLTTFGTGAGVLFTPASAGGTIATLLENPGIAIPGTAYVVAV